MKTFRSVLLCLLAVLVAATIAAAAVVTITEPSADQQQKAMFNRSMRATAVVDLDTGAKYALVAIKLAPGVDQPGDYAAMKTAIEAVSGVQEINLLVDGQAPASIPADHTLKLYATLHLRINANPE